MCNDFENNGVACITYIEENGTSVLPSDTALLKVLYLVTFETTKKWITTIRNWLKVYDEF